ncbi:Zinc finger, Sec23/Sec24-type [Pseudocohnilembus persalinus]|uniref:Zinc finger, Sec23/Sec24-type n=1 Tax=Pseudocohnilembus persalinus TaxID=266149 RepID=A0A0V0QJE2_PSEPJ|nr:Zinc finger, Sec23/Sec24-type [Pseudocohnilembus persalinus]|eukprot:KRX02234.1 Zinc finger, Sec23/Sec24-type [Pseudocohnilembus persalinus]
MQNSGQNNQPFQNQNTGPFQQNQAQNNDQQNYQGQQQNFQQNQQFQQNNQQQQNQNGYQQHNQFQNQQNQHSNNQHQYQQQQMQQQQHQQQQVQQQNRDQTTQRMPNQPANKLEKKKSSKIDTDQIPRPGTTLEESYNYKVFKTQSGYNTAPQSHQFFTTVDEGNAGPRFMRPTVNSLSNEPSLLNQCQIPLGVIVSPFAEGTAYEQDVPVSDYQDGHIQRCSRCKSYINPHWTFTDNGQSFTCNICKLSQKVPNDFYAPLDDYRQRTDKFDRPELHKGIYDFLAPKQYVQRKCESVCLMVCLEMSPAALQSGVYTQALNSLQASLDYMPAPEFTNIAIMTYDRFLNFYQIPKTLDQELGLIIVSDLDDPYCPLSKQSIYMNVQNDKDKINYLIESLLKNGENMQQQYEQNNKSYIQCPSVGSIVKSVSESMNDSTGRIIVFSSQFPQNGYGKLSKRDEVKLMNTDNEKQLYQPQGQQYAELAKQLLKSKIGVDMFIFAQSCDLATISLLTTMTGGSLYHYSDFDPNSDGERIHYDLFRNLTRVYAYDCMMTLRSSSGIVLHDYYTQQGKVSVRDLELSCIDSDKTIAVEIKQEDKIQENEAYLQFAILYTNQFGQKCIRVINQFLSVVNNANSIFRSGDLDATSCLLFRQLCCKITAEPLKLIKEQIIKKVVNVLHAYRVQCASQSPPGQLILPESLKLLGVLSNALFKQELFKLGGQVKVDTRISDLNKLFSLNANQLQQWIYPKLYPIHNIYSVGDENIIPGNQVEENVILPGTIPTSSERIDEEGVYLLVSNDYIYLFVGSEANTELLEMLFETSNLEEVQEITALPQLENDYSVRIAAIIDQLRRNKYGSYQGFKIVVSGSYYSTQFANLLVEDQIKGVESYADYLCTLHKLIQDKSG